MQFKKKRSITLNVDREGYITIDQAVKSADENFLQLIRRRKRK